jgi:hypothetical protein
MDWNDPEARLKLIERIGINAYNQAFAEHVRNSTVLTVAGHDIRIVGTRFGRLFQVGDTGGAFRTIEEAESFAYRNPKMEI